MLLQRLIPYVLATAVGASALSCRKKKSGGDDDEESDPVPGFVSGAAGQPDAPSAAGGGGVTALPGPSIAPASPVAPAPVAVPAGTGGGGGDGSSDGGGSDGSDPLPEVEILAPADGAYVNAASAGALTVSGTCNLDSGTVAFGGVAAGNSAPCTGGAFSKSLDLTAAADGLLTLSVSLGNTGGTANASVDLVKDVTVPTVAITAPTATDYVNAANAAAFTVSGDCSENGRNVALSGAATASVACAGGHFSTTLDLSGPADGAVTLHADLDDAAGNVATRSSVTLTKNTSTPTVSLSTPASGGYINASNANAVSVTGTCSENGRTVAIGGTRTASATCTAGGFSVSVDYSAVADGAVSITADHANVGGTSASQASVSITKDVGVPTVTLTSPANASFVNASNVGSITVGGACSEAGRTVTIGGGVSSTATCAGDNTWTKTLSYSGVSDGAVSITANLSDAAGNVATQASVSVTKDVALPTVTVTGPASYINDATKAAVTVGGACSEAGATITIGGAVSSTVACAGDNTWSKTLDYSAVSDGSVSITADVTDAAGNAATRATRTVTKDTGIPTVSLTSPAGAINVANAGSVTVGGACSEAGATVTIGGAVSSSVACAGDNTWSKTLDYSAVSDGSVSITANLSDAAGNPATQASLSVSKDTSAPTVTVTSPASYINDATKSSVTVGGACSEAGATVTIGGAVSSSVACAGDNTWSKTLDYSAVSDGSVSITANLSDDAGNPATQASHTVTKDTGLPTLSLTSPANGSYLNAGNVAAVTVAGACSEAGATVTIGGAVSTTTTCAGNNTFSKSVSYSGASEGSVSITVDLTDAAGNQASQASVTVTKDVGIPTVSFTSPGAGAYVTNANKASFAVGGSCSDAGRTISLGGCASTTVACGAGGTWSKNLDCSSNAEGAISLTANLSDAAGNAATQASLSVTKDTVATVAITATANGGYVNAANKAAYVVSGTCSDDGATVSIGGGVTSSATCQSDFTWSKTLDYSALSDGSVSLTANLTDAAGNAATQASATLTKDIVPPPAFSITGPSGVQTTLTPTIAWGSAEGGAVYEVQIAWNSAGTSPVSNQDYTGISATSKTLTNALINGQYYVFVTARDAAGNARSSSNDGYSMIATNATWSATAAPTQTQRGWAKTFWTGATGLSSTANRMVVWGGWGTTAALNSGEMYDPTGNSWTAMPTAGAPGKRWDTVDGGVAGVYTGDTGNSNTAYRFIVFGGTNGLDCTQSGTLSDGGVWNATTNTWSALPAGPTARCKFAIAYGGGKMFVFGGRKNNTEYKDGFVYDVAANTWSAAVSTTGAPTTARKLAYLVYTGATGDAAANKFLMWGGFNGGDVGGTYYNIGYLYDATANTWSSIATPTLNARSWGHYAMLGNKFLVWGGGGPTAGEYYADGAVYDTSTDTWSAMAASPLALRERGEFGVVNGLFTVWGGEYKGASDSSYTLYTDGATFDPANNRWAPIPSSLANTPGGRFDVNAALAPTKMMFFGGSNDDGNSNVTTGGVLTP